MKQRIVIAVGLPGSGKSTYFARLGVRPLSSDQMRLLLADDETDQTIHNRVFAALRYLLEQRIAIGRATTYIDATNLTAKDRRPWIEIAQKYGCEIEALYFDTPVELCKVRNAARNRIVPTEAMDSMAQRLEPPTLSEGFSRVEVAVFLPEVFPAASEG